MTNRILSTLITTIPGLIILLPLSCKSFSILFMGMLDRRRRHVRGRIVLRVVRIRRMSIMSGMQ